MADLFSIVESLSAVQQHAELVRRLTDELNTAPRTSEQIDAVVAQVQPASHTVALCLLLQHKSPSVAYNHALFQQQCESLFAHYSTEHGAHILKPGARTRARKYFDFTILRGTTHHFLS